jgi:hypothetical protein
MIFTGHAGTHNEQPLQRSISNSTRPFALAILQTPYSI